MKDFSKLFFLLLPTVFCGGPCTPRCGYSTYSQPPLPPLPRQAQYYWTPQQPVGPSYGYAQSPQLLAQEDKDMTTPIPTSAKSTAMEEIEKKLSALKPEPGEPIAIVEEKTITIASTPAPTTYYRPLNSYPQGPQSIPYAPLPYAPRPLPYRPHPMLPHGCPVLPPQYYRPIPYYPRGYVSPIVPPSYVIPPPQPPPPTPMPLPAPAYATPPPPLFPAVYPTSFPLPSNDCCGRCSSSCRYNRVNHVSKRTVPVQRDDPSFVPQRREVEEVNARCSSSKLRDIMNQSTTRTVTLSKRLIQKAAEELLGGMFSVFCSKEDFSYVARSQIFCQTDKNNISCYAFQHN